MITVFAEITAKSGKENELCTALKEIVPLSLSEPGCSEYRIHQSQNDLTKFFAFEIFNSIEDFESHLASSHFVELQKKAKDLLAAEPRIELTREVINN